MAKILSPLDHLLQTRIFSGNSADHSIRDPNEKLKMRDVAQRYGIGDDVLANYTRQFEYLVEPYNTGF
jgi:hypothetical protein